MKKTEEIHKRILKARSPGDIEELFLRTLSFAPEDWVFEDGQTTLDVSDSEHIEIVFFHDAA